MCVCVVLFVASKTFDKSELLSCLLEMGVEYYLVCIREGLLCGKGVGGARESQLFVGVYYNKTVFKDIGSEHFVVYLSCVYIYICSAGDAELPVVLYLLQCLVYHMLSKRGRNSGSLHSLSLIHI